MNSAVLLLSVDPSLGRVHFNELPDQTLMELLYEGFDEETQQRYQDYDGIYVEISMWSSVKCDNTRSVIEINEQSAVSGSLQLCYIPLSVKVFNMSWKRLTGSIDLTRLKESLQQLNLSHNQLTGPVCLTKLPERIERIALNHNQLAGSIDLTQLPGKTRSLALQENQFTGSIDLTNLPESMRKLHVFSNQLSGSFIATNLPPMMREISAGANQFSSTAVVDSKTRAGIDLRKSGVNKAVDENGGKWVKGVSL